jgi:hypothetical protein
MQKLRKLFHLGLLTSGLLMATACHEQAADSAKQQLPPVTIKVTGPPGYRQGDSASFNAIMRGDVDPDTSRLKNRVSNPRPRTIYPK